MYYHPEGERRGDNLVQNQKLLTALGIPQASITYGENQSVAERYNF